MNKTSRKFDIFFLKFLGILAVLTTTIALLVAQSSPRVMQTFFRGQYAGGPLKQIVIQFSRDMDRSSVEKNFVLTPPLPGKLSWSGRNLIFTTPQIFPAESEFKIEFSSNVQDANGKNLHAGFSQTLRTPKLEFAYIGAEGEEKDRLIVQELTNGKKQILTDPELKIEHYQFCPDRSCLYFLGYKEKHYQNNLSEIFRLDLPSRKISQITHDQNFLNKTFRLSPDGKWMIVSRIAYAENGEYLSRIQLWIASTADYNFKLFKKNASGLNYFFTPDSASLLHRNDQDNFELANLQNSQEKPLFMGNFSHSYGFHPSKPIIAFVKYNEEDIFSVVNNFVLYFSNGEKTEVAFGKGLARDSVFTPDGKKIITLFSEEKDIFDDKESFYPLRIFHLYSYDLETNEIRKLTDDFDYSEEGQTISPDGRYLLFERYETLSGHLVIDPDYRDVAASLGDVSSGGELWLLDLQTSEMKSLGLKGRDVLFAP